METDKIEEYKAHPWHPIKDSVDLKHLGKLMEECGELVSAAARCMIQGMDECDPETGKLNRDWLQDEIADVVANCMLVSDRFELNDDYIQNRSERKAVLLRSWHKMA